MVIKFNLLITDETVKVTEQQKLFFKSNDLQKEDKNCIIFNGKILVHFTWKHIVAFAVLVQDPSHAAKIFINILKELPYQFLNG